MRDQRCERETLHQNCERKGARERYREMEKERGNDLGKEGETGRERERGRAS